MVWNVGNALFFGCKLHIHGSKAQVSWFSIKKEKELNVGYYMEMKDIAFSKGQIEWNCQNQDW